MVKNFQDLIRLLKNKRCIKFTIKYPYRIWYRSQIIFTRQLWVILLQKILCKRDTQIWRLNNALSRGAAIAQWIRLHLPSCCPGFDYQAQHLHFLNLSLTWFDKWLVFCSTSASMAAKSAKILRSPTLELLGRTMRTARLSL